MYIGITSLKVNVRWKNGEGYKKCPLFYNAIQKYGWDNIEHEIVFEGLSKDEACVKEQELISFYKSNTSDYGYNLTTGGESCEVSEITRSKISKVHKGVPKSEEHRRKIGDSQRGAKNHMYGKHQTEEACRKMSESSIGKRLSEQHCQNISSARINNPLISRKVAQYTLDDEFIAEYPSLGEANRASGIPHGNISKCCRGVIKQSGGFKWKYI